MKFCDKLVKLRKQNNITQEQLADRLGISRQAVSKWELGVSIPDMEKILELCNILNCTLEDLLDDGVIGESKNSNSKTNFSNYFQDFLKYITNIYNMFYSMKFLQKLKCLLEMTFLFFLIFILLFIVHEIIDSMIIDNLFYIPVLGNYLYIFLNNIFIIFLIIIGVIIFFHILKIRYLDYYITIEDKNTLEKKVEKEIKEKDIKEEAVKVVSKEKIIIRDPKHSTFSFFEFLSKILLFITKIFAFVILIFIIIFFILTLITLFFFIWHIKYGNIFWYLIAFILGILFIIYIFIELFYNFIISKKQHFKRIFILAIIGFIIFSFGISSTIVSVLNFESNYNISYQTKVFEFNIDDSTILIDNNYFNMSTNYIFDENIKNIKIVANYPKNIDGYLNNYNELDYKVYLLFFHRDYLKTYSLILDMIKQGKITNLDELEKYDLTIYLSSENYQKLLKTQEKYQNTIYME